MYYYTLLELFDKNKPLVMKKSLVIIILVSMNIFIAISPRSASGQEDQDKNLAFVKDLDPSSYSKVVEDESLIREIASAVTEVGNTIMSNSSLCSIIDDIDRCDSVALSLTSYLSDYNFEDATSKIDEAKDRLADFQQYPTFEALDGFAKANSDVAKSLYELLIKSSNGLEGIDSLSSYDRDVAGAGSPISTISMILIDAGMIINNDHWTSFGERLSTLVSNFEQKYSEINAITGIANSVDVDSLPRNEFGFYAIGFGIAGGLIVIGIMIQLLLRGKKQNQFGM
jgi:hypothetical protein